MGIDRGRCRGAVRWLVGDAYVNYLDAQPWFTWLDSGHSPFTCVAMIVHCGQIENLIAFPLEEG